MDLATTFAKIGTCSALVTVIHLKRHLWKSQDTLTHEKHNQEMLLLISGAYVGLSLMVLLPESDTMYRASQQGSGDEVVFPLGYVAATIAFSVLMLLDKIVGYDYHQQTEELLDEEEEVATVEMVSFKQQETHIAINECQKKKDSDQISEIKNYLCVEASLIILGMSVGASSSMKLLALIAVPILVHMWIKQVQISEGYLDVQLIQEESLVDVEQRGKRRDDKQKAMAWLFVIGAILGLLSTFFRSQELNSLILAIASGSFMYVGTVKLIAQNYDEHNYPLAYYLLFTLGLTATTFLYYYHF